MVRCIKSLARDGSSKTLYLPPFLSPMSNTIFEFFGLRENPFKINPDPRFLFATDQSRAAADELTYGIRTRKGLILLTGEVGTGKTMLIRRLLDWLAEQKMPTALIFNSHIQSDHLLDFILNDFGVPCTSTIKSEKLLALNAWLLDRYRAGQTPVLIVDEAQGLEPVTLEEIRLLLNLETPREKLLQIVLAGQPELEVKLKRHELRQLRQRITIRCRTAPLTLEQTRGYISERLNVAGANDNPLFEPAAVTAVHAYAHGIPRVINVLCEHALINACAEGALTISPAIVERAAIDCQLDRADSVARILQTGSYSAAELSDASSILATVAATSEQTTLAPPKSKIPSTSSTHVPATLPNLSQHTPRAAAAAEFATATTQLNHFESETIQSDPISSSTVAPSIPENEVQPPQPLSAEPETVSRRPVYAPQPSPMFFVRHWAQSFAADSRACARQFRRAVHSFEVHTLQPRTRELRHQFRKLLAGASRTVSHPRWQQLPSRAISATRSSLRGLMTMARPWLDRPLRSYRGQSAKRAQSAPLPRAVRRRPIASLRKWLHEPLNSQQKRMEGSERRSVN